MTRYAKVLSDQILAYSNTAPDGDQSLLAAGKPRWLPVVTTDPEFDPVTEVKEGPALTMADAEVDEVYTVRAKNSDEVAAMIAEKDAAIEAAFNTLCDAPIAFTAGGTTYTWDADAGARENIMGVVLMIAAGVPVPDPRPFTPHDSDTPVDVAHAEFVGLGAAIAARKDALYVIKKTRQAALAAMTDPAMIDAIDPTTGWE